METHICFYQHDSFVSLIFVADLSWFRVEDYDEYTTQLTIVAYRLYSHSIVYRLRL